MEFHLFDVDLGFQLKTSSCEETLVALFFFLMEQCHGPLFWKNKYTLFLDHRFLTFLTFLGYFSEYVLRQICFWASLKPPSLAPLLSLYPIDTCTFTFFLIQLRPHGPLLCQWHLHITSGPLILTSYLPRKPKPRSLQDLPFLYLILGCWKLLDKLFQHSDWPHLYVGLTPQLAPLSHLQCLCSSVVRYVCHCPQKLKHTSPLSNFTTAFPGSYSVQIISLLPREKKSTDKCFLSVLSPNSSSWHYLFSFHPPSWYTTRVYDTM